jgi:predicted transcriptional regulator
MCLSISARPAYVRQRILQGERAADAGELVRHEQVMSEAQEWLKRQ